MVTGVSPWLEALAGGPQGVKDRLTAGGGHLVAAAADRARRTEDGVNRVMLISMVGTDVAGTS